MELVSAIVCTYNRPVDTVLRAVKSIKNQTYQNIEIIVVNDCPGNIDLVAKLESELKALDDKIRYYVNEENKGISANRNVGLSYAKGKYIAYLDDDDEWAPNKIEMQVSEMSGNVALVYGNFIIKDGEKSFVSYRGRHFGNLLKEILKENFVGGTSFPLINTEYLKSIGGFDENATSGEEYDVWIRLISRYEIRYVNSPLGFYSMSSDSVFKNDNSKYTMWRLYFLKKYRDLLVRYPLIYMSALKSDMRLGENCKDKELYDYCKKMINESGIKRALLILVPIVNFKDKVLTKLRLN